MTRKKKKKRRMMMSKLQRSKLFEDILQVQSHSGHEEGMVDFITAFLTHNDQRSTDLFTDEVGNIYVTVGQADTYPLLVSHTDTVHNIIEPGLSVTEEKGKRITTETLPYTVKHYTNKQKQLCYTSPTGVGGDDKCGIYILLRLYLMSQTSSDLPPFKMFFPVGEEVGMTGTAHALHMHEDWFSNIAYMIEPDRRGRSDIICSDGDTLADDLNDHLSPIFKQHGYKITTGSVTDVFKISPVIDRSCFNPSCGYYSPHSADEYIIFPEVLNCLSMIKKVLMHVPVKPYPRPLKSTTVTVVYDYTSYNWGKFTSRDKPRGRVVRGSVSCPFKGQMLELSYDIGRDYFSLKNGSFYSMGYTEFEKAYIYLTFYGLYLQDDPDIQPLTYAELDELFSLYYDI
jgi:hypothetical protein